jgi:hypothetical protein
MREFESLLQAPSPSVLTTYRKDGTAVASSVSFLFRDNTFEVRAVPLRTAMTTTTLQ